MIARADMLVSAAEKAGIKVPEDPEQFDSVENHTKFRRFFIFCVTQIGASMPYWGCHFDNAKVIANLPEERLETITMQELIDEGFAVGYSK